MAHRDSAELGQEAEEVWKHESETLLWFPWECWGKQAKQFGHWLLLVISAASGEMPIAWKLKLGIVW